jgi:hypothetical protein
MQHGSAPEVRCQKKSARMLKICERRGGYHQATDEQQHRHFRKREDQKLKPVQLDARYYRALYTTRDGV